MAQRTRKEREGEEQINNQGCLMKIIEYNSFRDITVEFQDEYKTVVKSQYHHFIDGNIINPYYPSVYGVGVVGSKYQSHFNQRATKEYNAWKGILQRSFNKEYKNRKPTYKNVACCDEWLLFENFYEWIHSQNNFDKWYNNQKWHIDKDILSKGNKIYSPEKCCLVPQRVNSILNKNSAARNDLPIGVKRHLHGNKYVAECHDADNNTTKHLGIYDSPEEAFNAYKQYKENIIKQVAQIEFDAGNITEECYNAMLRYEVDITD